VAVEDQEIIPAVEIDIYGTELGGVQSSCPGVLQRIGNKGPGECSPGQKQDAKSGKADSC
jgi:hypothetical protein